MNHLILLTEKNYVRVKYRTWANGNIQISYTDIENFKIPTASTEIILLTEVIYEK